MAGSVELKGYDIYHVNAKISGLDVRELAALGTTRAVPYDGLVVGHGPTLLAGFAISPFTESLARRLK